MFTCILDIQNLHFNIYIYIKAYLYNNFLIGTPLKIHY